MAGPRSRAPRPGRAVRGSTTGRPIMALLDLLGRRACLRILWELRHGGLTFRALQDAADTNPSVLNTRLAELREAGIVAHVASGAGATGVGTAGPIAGATGAGSATGGYHLTERGRQLLDHLAPLHAWAEAWRS